MPSPLPGDKNFAVSAEEEMRDLQEKYNLAIEKNSGKITIPPGQQNVATQVFPDVLKSLRELWDKASEQDRRWTMYIQK